MNAHGPIVLIEDDPDDQSILEQIFQELNLDNELKIFSEGLSALEFLRGSSVYPFLVISDINLPSLNGFEIRDIISKDADLSNKCIPYLFFTTGATQLIVRKAYDLSVQGIFQKPNSYEKWKALIDDVTRYWKQCMSPNHYV